MHLPLQEPPQQYKVLAELVHSQQLVQPEEYQIGQLAVEVIKLYKEMEAARLEALALDKELQLSTLLDKLDLDPLGDPHLPPQVEVSQEGFKRSNNKGPKHCQLRGHLQEDHQDNQRDPQVANHRRDHQEDHQKAHQEAHHRQQHRNKQYRHPMGQMGLWKDNHLPSLMEKGRREANSWQSFKTGEGS